MKSTYPLRGIVAVLNTPFTTSGQVDYASVKRHVERALEARVDGFLVSAMASEVNKLSLEERIKLVASVLEVTDHSISVFAGISHNDPGRRETLMKAYLELGCNQVLFQIPFQNETQFKGAFLRLAEFQPGTIMLQDWDSSGYGLPDELILDLFEEVDAFRCLKVETTPAGLKYSRILEVTEGRLHVSGGWAVNQMMEGLERGIHAFMPTGMYFIYTQIYRDYISGQVGRARALFESILPVLSFSNQHLDISVHFFKRLLYRQGIYDTPCVRTPILPFDAIHEAIAERLIRRVLLLEYAIKRETIDALL